MANFPTRKVRFTTKLSFELDIANGVTPEQFRAAFEKAVADKAKLVGNTQELLRRLRLLSERAPEGLSECDLWTTPVRAKPI